MFVGVLERVARRGRWCRRSGRSRRGRRSTRTYISGRRADQVLPLAEVEDELVRRRVALAQPLEERRRRRRTGRRRRGRARPRTGRRARTAPAPPPRPRRMTPGLGCSGRSGAASGRAGRRGRLGPARQPVRWRRRPTSNSYAYAGRRPRACGPPRSSRPAGAARGRAGRAGRSRLSRTARTGRPGRSRTPRTGPGAGRRTAERRDDLAHRGEHGRAAAALLLGERPSGSG